MLTVERFLFQISSASIDGLQKLSPYIFDDKAPCPLFHISPASEADAAILADSDSFVGLAVGYLNGGSPAEWALGSNLNLFHSKFP